MTAALERTNGHAVDVEALYRERRDRLAGVARAAGGDEDSVQDAFVRLIEDPDRVRKTPEAFLTTETRMGPRRERAARRDTPVGEHIDRTADDAPEGNGLPCMGDPVVAAKVNAALATLPPADARAVRLHLLDGRPASEVAKQLGVDLSTVYRMVNRSMTRLADLGVRLDEDEPAESEPGAPASMAALVATLGREFSGKRVSVQVAEEALRRLHGRCSTSRAVQAQKTHNAGLPDAAPAVQGGRAKKVKRRGRGAVKPKGRAVQVDDAALIARCRKVAEERGVVLTQTAIKAEFNVGWPRAQRIFAALNGAPADAAPVVPTLAAPAARSVAEVWLMGATPPISCLLVHSDETTEPATLAAVSMLGAQREITGRLISDGYKPDGPWVDVDPAAPESMRKFQQGGAQ